MQLIYILLKLQIVSNANNLYETTKAIIVHLVTGDLDVSICALLAGGFEEQSNNSITSYIALHSDHSIDTSFLFARRNELTKRAIQEHNKKVKKDYWDNFPLDEALQTMVQAGGYPNSDQRKYLQRFKADDYKAIFLAHQQDGIWRKMVHWLLQSKQISNSDEEDKIIIPELENSLDSMETISLLVKWVVQTIRT